MSSPLLASGVPLYLQTLKKFNIGAFLGSYCHLYLLPYVSLKLNLGKMD